jgi:hypothetical protein
MSPDSHIRAAGVNRSGIVLVQGAVFLAALAALFGLWSDEQYTTALTWPLCACFSLHLVWSLWSWRAVTGRWLDAYTLFFLSLCFFNGGQFLLETFNLNRNGLLREAFSVATTNRTILLVIAAAAGCHFGGLVQCLRKSCSADCGQTWTAERCRALFSTHRAKEIGLLFLAVSAPATLFNLLNSVQDVAANGYMALYQREQLIGADNWRNVLSGFFVPGILITLAMSRKSPREIRICWGMTLAYTLASLFIGTRGSAVMACVPMALLHHNLVHRIRPVYMIGGAVLMLSLFSLIAQTRDESLEGRYDMINALVTDNPLVAVVSEMGGSAATVAHTIELVPRTRDFDYGQGYGYALLTVVPNLFWDLHPSTQWGKYGDWLVWTVSPGTAIRGGGFGYSVVAEAYANFSVLGAPLVLAILGFAIAGIVSWARNTQSPFPAAIEAILLSSIIMLPRSESASIVRLIIWFCVVPWILVKTHREPSETRRWNTPPQRAAVSR